MPAEQLLYQHKVSGACLELTREGDDCTAHLTYPYPDPRFEQGGTHTVLAVLRTLAERLAQRDRLQKCFWIEISLPPPADGEDHSALQRRWDEALEDREQGRLGEIDAFEGCWFTVREALALLAELGPEHARVSAEEVRVRLLLLEHDRRGAQGWDLCHQDGITSLGRWRLEATEEPGPLDPEDIEPTRALFDDLARSVLGPRLAN